MRETEFFGLLFGFTMQLCSLLPMGRFRLVYKIDLILDSE